MAESVWQEQFARLRERSQSSQRELIACAASVVAGANWLVALQRFGLRFFRLASSFFAFPRRSGKLAPNELALLPPLVVLPGAFGQVLRTSTQPAA